MYINRSEHYNRIAGGLIALFVLRFFFGYLQQYLVSFIGERVVVDLRTQVYTHLHNLSLRFFTERRVGELVSRLSSDVTLIRTALTNNIVTVLSQTLTFIGALVIIIVLNWRLTLFVLVLAPAVGLSGALFGRRLRKISTQVQDELADSTTIIEEALQGIRVVKSFVREPFEIQRYADALQKTFDAAIRLTRVRSAFGPLMYTLAFVTITGVLWFGGREVIAGRLTVGGLAGFLFYTMTIAGAIGAMTNLYTQLQEAIGASLRVFEILDSVPGVEDRPGAQTLKKAEGRLTFEDLHFAYDERAPVFRGISLNIEPGEVFALFGPSGAGKTTISYLIPRLYDVTEGAVRIDDIDVRDIRLASLAGLIGYVSQETYLFHASLRSNLLYGNPDATQKELEEAAKTAFIHDRILEFPDGYDTVVGERGYRLSGGERQRLSIARVVLHQPKILILDEATSALDTTSERYVQTALEPLMKERTTIAIAHRLSTIIAADDIYFVDRGKVVERGTHVELLARDGQYAALYREQFDSGRIESRCEDGIVLADGEVVRREERAVPAFGG